VAGDREALLALTAASVVIADQALKAAVLRVGSLLRLGSFLRIRPVRSSVIASGFGFRVAALFVAWVVITLMIVFVVPYSGLFHSLVSGLALGVALGGAASNLLDLILRGVVVDYIDVRVWPVFNLGDAAIVSGVLLAFIAR
jgi:signal peptidase II